MTGRTQGASGLAGRTHIDARSANAPHARIRAISATAPAQADSAVGGTDEPCGTVGVPIAVGETPAHGVTGNARRTGVLARARAADGQAVVADGASATLPDTERTSTRFGQAARTVAVPIRSTRSSGTALDEQAGEFVGRARESSGRP